MRKEVEKEMRIVDAIRMVEEGRGYLLIRNPVKRGQKPIEFVEVGL